MEKARKEYERKALLEYDIAVSLENFVKHDFIDLRDVCKFSPEMFSRFQKECMADGQDTSMVSDGVYHYRTDPQGRKYYVDTKSGLVLLQDGASFSIAKHACTSKHYDIFDAAYLRRFILHPESRKQTLFFFGDPLGEITTLDYLGLQVADVFSEPIIDYTVSSKNELEEVISEIHSRLSESKFFRKLWFRGQRREYTANISETTVERLGFPKAYAAMPSLIPSAARVSGLEAYRDMREMSMYWNTAFKVWLLSQTNGVVPEFQVDGLMYHEMIRSLEPLKMADFLRNNPYDIEEYVFEKDIEPMWASVLASQQYGGLTSMLDITDDIDIALFFTQSYLDAETKRFVLCEPDSANVIYVLAGTRGSSTADRSQSIFDYIHHDGPYPVPPRIFNQHCGLLRGADMLSRNTYAYRILARIQFSGGGVATTKNVDEMFPGKDEDTLYKTYSYAEPRLTGLYG